jgi:hypothetical protein
MGVGYRIDGLDQIGNGVRPGSNLVRQFIEEWARAKPVRGRRSSGCERGLTAGRHGRSPELGGTAATMLHLLQGFFLRIQNDMWNLFYNPWAAETGYTKWAMAVFFTPT